MRLPRRLATGRGRLSLRSRLLAGLITVTALFLIVMGVVTTVVLGNSEQAQFNTDLSLTARVKLSEIADLTGGYAAAYIILREPRQVTPAGCPRLGRLVRAGDCWRTAGQRTGGRTSARANPEGKQFSISQPGGPSLTAIWRLVTATEAAHSEGLLPAGESVVVSPVRPARSAARSAAWCWPS